MTPDQPLIQINLQQHFGGGEVYTRFLTQALQQLGQPTQLLVQRNAAFWRDLDLGNATLIPVRDLAEGLDWLDQSPRWILSHGSVGEEAAARLATRHRLWGISHMPARGKNRFRHYHRVCGVSHHVLDTLRAAEVANIDTKPLLGVADLSRLSATLDRPIMRQSRYDWDQRKFRDRLFGWLEPLVAGLQPRPAFQRRSGLTLGIVSRLTPIKQFPTLFQLLTPLIAQHPTIHLEIFGAGGYASVRDLRQALRPLGTQVRFWGQQREVGTIYRQLDFVLSGLPENEALGLNLLEAQACGTPVLAINAPPFTETVADGLTGWLYRDPRQDAGADFSGLLSRLHQGLQLPPPATWQTHLAKFDQAHFTRRIAELLQTAECPQRNP